MRPGQQGPGMKEHAETAEEHVGTIEEYAETSERPGTIGEDAFAMNDIDNLLRSTDHESREVLNEVI